MQLQCRKCNYDFEKAAIPSKCPYCSAEGSVRPYKTAQDWLDETDY